MFESSKTVKQLFYINCFAFIFGTILQMIGVPFYENLSLWTGPNFNPTQLITYQFLHGGILHILFNMLALLSFGPTVEDYFGRNKFIAFYLISGIGSALLHISVMSTDGPMLGASGSIFGVAVVYAIINPNQIINLFGLIPIKSKYLIWSYVTFELISVLSSVDDGTSHLGHIGGALTGVLLYIIDKKLLSFNRVKKWS